MASENRYVTGSGRPAVDDPFLSDLEVADTPWLYRTYPKRMAMRPCTGSRAVEVMLTFFRADVRKEERVRDLVSYREAEFGRVDALVNNPSAPHDESIDSWMDSRRRTCLEITQPGGPLTPEKCSCVLVAEYIPIARN